MRFILLGVAALWFASGPTAAADLRLLIMEPEIDGDLGPATEEAWRQRLDLLRNQVSKSIAERGSYVIVDPKRAARSFEKHSHRRGVFDCQPCAIESATEASADRTLSIRVFRMSNLVLSMQAKLREADTGAVRYARAWDFRGDTDKAWLHAAERMTRGINQTNLNEK